MGYTVHVLQDGYSKMENGAMLANCSCTLIKGPTNIIVDTMTAWDKSIVEKGVVSNGLSCDDIGYAIATHGHSDHLGNLNLFVKAKHIVGFTVSFQNEFFIHPFETGEPYKIDENVEVVPTPGHTTADVSVVVRTQDMGTVVVAGDLFEKEEDIADESIWKYVAGSENPEQQAQHRRRMLAIADYIVPGHGPMFRVTPKMRKTGGS